VDRVMDGCDVRTSVADAVASDFRERYLALDNFGLGLLAKPGD
jgi:hypothetical protein